MSLPPGSQLAVSPLSQTELSPERGVCRGLRGHVEGASLSSWGAEVGLSPEESGLALRRFGLGAEGCCWAMQVESWCPGPHECLQTRKARAVAGPAFHVLRNLGMRVVVGRWTGGSGCQSC